MQRKVSQVASREWVLFSTTCQEEVQSCSTERALAGPVRAAALPLFHTVEETTRQGFSLYFRVLISTNAHCFQNYFLTFEVCRTLKSLETK